jgi:glycosyltransferase 2 family protein
VIPCVGVEAGRRPIKKTLRNVIVFAVIVAALYLLLPRIIDLGDTLTLMSSASYALLGAAVAVQVPATLSYGVLTQYILRVLDIRLRLSQVLAITMSSFAVSHLISAGGVSGWVVTYNALRKRMVPHGVIFVAIAAQQFFNYVVLWFAFAIALIYLVVARNESIAGYSVGIALIVALLWGIAYSIYLYNRRSRMRLRVTQIAHLINRVARRQVIEESHIEGWLDSLFTGMRRLTSHRGAFRTTTVLACGYWLFDMLCLYIVFLAFGQSVGFAALVVCYVVANAVGAMVPTPGGLGAIEGIMIALFVSFGVPSATAVAVVLVYRLINFWLPIAPGLVGYVVIRPGRGLVEEREFAEVTATVLDAPSADPAADSAQAGSVEPESVSPADPPSPTDTT